MGLWDKLRPNRLSEKRLQIDNEHNFFNSLQWRHSSDAESLISPQRHLTIETSETISTICDEHEAWKSCCDAIKAFNSFGMFARQITQDKIFFACRFVETFYQKVTQKVLTFNLLKLSTDTTIIKFVTRPETVNDENLFSLSQQW